MSIKGSRIAKNACVHASATIGEGVTIGERTTIEENVFIEKNVTIGEGVIIGEGAVVEKNTIIEKDVRIGDMTIIRHDVAIRRQTVVCAKARVGTYVEVGARVMIPAGAIISPCVIIIDGTTIPQIHCNPLQVNLSAEDKVAIGSMVYDRRAMEGLVISAPVRDAAERLLRSRARIYASAPFRETIRAYREAIKLSRRLEDKLRERGQHVSLYAIAAVLCAGESYRDADTPSPNLFMEPEALRDAASLFAHELIGGNAAPWVQWRLPESTAIIYNGATSVCSVPLNAVLPVECIAELWKKDVRITEL